MKYAENFTKLLCDNEQLLEKINKELGKMPEGSLYIRNVKGRVNYCQNVNGEKRGITTNKELVHILARKKYLRLLKSQLEINIKNLRVLTEKYKSVEPKDIINQLPEYLRNMPIEVYVPYHKRQNVWMNEPFAQSTFNLEEKNQVTARGLWVRSKSEVIIAEKLDEHNIPYRYEQVIQIGSRSYVPDFTILTKDGIKYWEHCGLVNDPDYMKKHHWKISVYESAGIVPWKNLIITYDNEVGGIDSRIIESEIVNKLI